MQQSILSLWFNSASKIYDVKSVNLLVSFLEYIADWIFRYFKNIQFTRSFFILRFPWKAIFISLFLISFVFGGGDGIQFSELPSSRIVPSLISSRIFSLNPLSLKALTIIFLIFCFLKEYKRNGGRIRFLRLETFMIILILTSMLSTVFSFSIKASLIWLLKLVASMIVYFIFSRIQLSRKDLLLISWVSLGILFFEEALALGQYIMGSFLALPFENLARVNLKTVFFPTEDKANLRVIGSFVHPKILSFYIALWLPLTIVLSLTKNKFLKSAAIGSAILGILTIILTLSRWELVVSLIGMLLTLFLIRRNAYIAMRKTLMNKLALIILLSFFIFLLINPVTAERFFEFDITKGTFNVRSELVSQALFMIQSHPLIGIGGSSFQPYFVNYDITDSKVSERFLWPVHSFYLLLLTELGFLGVIVLFAILADLIYLFIKRIAILPIENRLFCIAFFCYLAVYLLDGIVEPRTIVSILGFWFPLALCVNLLKPFPQVHKNIRAKI